jgi:hypothetical protein
MGMEITNTMELIQNNIGLFNNSPYEFDLSSVIENLKAELTWEKGELNTKILLKSPELNIVLVKMHKETEIISFQKNQSVTFQILQGELKLHIRKGSLSLKEGESLILYEKTKYRIVSMEATAILLTLAS